MALLNRTIVRAEAPFKSGVRLRPILLIAAVSIVVIALVQIIQTSKATTANYGIQRLESRQLELESSVRQIESEVATLSSLTRVQDDARRMGLEPAKQRFGIEVGLPWPAEGTQLPSRYQAVEDKRTNDEGGSPLWRDVLGLLPLF